MTWQSRYISGKERLLKDRSICTSNRQLFNEFFEQQEYLLKRIRGNASLDENSYRTMVTYITRLRTVNRWFSNKSWRDLRKADIQRVYDDVEEGRITTHTGQPLKDKHTYYRILRGKPFEIAGKKDLAKAVLRLARRHDPEDVRFIREPEFRRLVEAALRTDHRTFLWLCWDIGENATAILQLRKLNCVRQINSDTREPEYLINLPKEILKRSRKPRSELTNYPETVEYLDRQLNSLSDDSHLFSFGASWAKKFFLRGVKETSVRCLPGGSRPTLKDLRSSMACDLLSKGWSRDEVNARLGHSPSSKEIDRYINYLAIDRNKPKRKVEESRIAALTRDIEAIREQLKLTSNRLQKAKESNAANITRLKKVAILQCQVATSVIESQLMRADSPSYVREIDQMHRALLQAQALLNSDETSHDDAIEGSI